MKAKKMESINEFVKMWNEGLVNYIYEHNGTEIVADRYEIIIDRGEDSVIHLYYDYGFVAKILLKNVKTIY